MSEQMPDNSDIDIRELREAADRGTNAVREADLLRRELAFNKAGIDTDTPLGAMFAKSYDGKLEMDQVKEAWQQIALAAQPPVPAEPTTATPTAQELEQTEIRRLLTSGGAGDTPADVPLPDPVERGYEIFHERLAKGERRETAAGAVIGSLIEAANNGDDRAIFTGWTAEELSR